MVHLLELVPVNWKSLLIKVCAILPVVIGFNIGFGSFDSWSWGVWGWYAFASFLAVDFAEDVILNER